MAPGQEWAKANLYKFPEGTIQFPETTPGAELSTEKSVDFFLVCGAN
jgi:hypothetical protein